jgi:hypothetical protein
MYTYTHTHIHVPCSEPACLETNKHRTDEFAEACGVYGIYLVSCAVSQVVVVEGTAREADTFSCFVVL